MTVRVMRKHRDRNSGSDLNKNLKPRKLALRQIPDDFNHDEEKYYVFILVQNEREALRI
jgi:hypothetical protein